MALELANELGQLEDDVHESHVDDVFRWLSVVREAANEVSNLT
jgi:hypothetical protein